MKIARGTGYNPGVKTPHLPHLAAVLLLLVAGSARAQPLVEITPRAAADWRVIDAVGEATVSVDLAPGSRGGPDPVWRFQADCPYQENSAYITLELRLEDFRIPPQPREAIEYIQWEWYIGNRESADKVTMRIGSETSGLPLGASASLFDGNDDTFATLDRYQEVHTTVTEAAAFKWRDGEPETFQGPFTDFAITLHMPYKQTVELGVIRFGPARENPPPQTPRQEKKRLAIGRYVPADLDGDGVVELLAPWREGPKVMRYSRETGDFEFVEDSGALSRPEPLYLALPEDLDQDGDLDVIGLEPNLIEITVFRNERGRFRAEGFYLPLPEPDAIPMAMTVTDADGDGWVDLFVAYHLQITEDVPRIFRLPGGPDGFGDPLPVAEAVPPRFWGAYWIAAADMDGDGAMDLVSGAPGIGIHVFPGDGRGNFGVPVEMLALRRGGFHRGIDLVDVNGDRLIDLLYAQTNSSGEADRDGCQHLVLNRGEFRFMDVSTAVGICGGQLSEASLPTEIDGQPGLEWLVQEQDGFHLWNLAPLAAAEPGSLPRLDPPTLLLPDAVKEAGRLVTVQDFNGDGSADLVYGGEAGLRIYHTVLPPGDGDGVRTITAGGVGPKRVVRGGTLGGRGWSEPLLVNTLGRNLPRLVAGGETVTWNGGAPSRAEPGSITNLTGFSDFATDLRHRPGKFLPRLEWGAPNRALVVVLLTLLVLAVLAHRRYRRIMAREESRAWRELLRTVEVTRHSGWRTSVGNLQRRILMKAGLESFREALPRNKIRALGDCIRSAQRLGVEGHQMAARNLSVLEAMHGPGPPDEEKLEAACRDLLLAMDLVTGSIREHFSCDPQRVFRSALGELDHRRTSATTVTWAGPAEQDPRLAERFPMHEDDLFACIQELVRNALKKNPAPGRVVVRVFAEGSRNAVLAVVDDGGTVEREKARETRSGNRQGLRDLARTLDPYAGFLSVTDLPDGSGVEARVTVKLADA